ncbi:ABC transporter permease [Anaerosolibacter sp.]|uniref:ABC transporter permease n=1 Tax=Anaerosolibacter sp. TaxID=1872527 RepID=UPI0039F11494
MSGIVDLGIWQLLSAYIFVIFLLVIVRIKGISREKEILISSIRMTLQLIFVGYILAYLFENDHPGYTLLVIGVMETFAIFNIYKRVKGKLSMGLKKVIALSMASGTLLSIAYFLFVVIQISPWYKTQYFVPLAGMIIGNSMTGIALGVDRLVDGMRSKKDMVETALMLGATPKAASKTIVDHAFDSAIMPTINSMVGMGIVFLPGMMTGQILSGTSPLTAIEYQIAVMLGILGSVSLTVFLFVQMGYQSFFNKEKQLVVNE